MIFRIAWRKRFSALAFVALLFFAASSRTRALKVQQAAPSHSQTSQADREQSSVTADQQEMRSADHELTRKIRSADKSLPTYAHHTVASQESVKDRLQIAPKRS